MVFFFFLLFDDNKKNIFAYLALIAVTFSGAFIYSLNNGNLYQYALKVWHWFLMYQNTENNYKTQYAFTIMFICIVVVCLFIYLIYKNRILYYITTVGFLTWLIYCSIVKINLNKITVGLLLIVIIQVVVEISNHLYNKKNQSNYNLTNLYLLPLCMIIGLIAVSMPSKSYPIQWKIIKRIASTAVDKWDDITFRYGILTGEYSDEFNVSFTGYVDDEDSKLGGQVISNQQSILEIEPNENTYGSTYLIGSVRDEYTSKGWKRSSIDYVTNREPEVDFYQILYGMYLNHVTPKENEILFHRMNLDVEYTNIKTKNLFYPLKMYQLEMLQDDYNYDYSSPTLLTNKLLKKGFYYQVKYYEINYDSDTIQNYLRNMSKTDGTRGIKNQVYNRQDCIEYVKSLLNLNYLDETILNNEFYSLLQKRESIIKEYYTKVPEQVPKRVYDLAYNITSKYDNNYDKLRAIENYFKAFPYTLTPSKTNKGEDFVDYFLFEQKEGYCTYFASAMAILARCVDIPTRYVEGLLIGYNMKQGEKNVIKGGSAHAWVEAYIDGVGWIPFEPTPGKYTDRYSLWPRKAKSNTIVDAKAPIPQTSTGYIPSQYKQKVKEIMLSKEDIKRIKYMFYTGIIIVVVMIILLISVMIGLNQNRKNKYKNASSMEKVQYLIRKILDYLKLEGLELEVGETLTDFSNRVGDSYDFNDKTLKEVCFVYTKLRYHTNGGKQLSEADIKKVIEYQRELKQYIKKNVGWMQKLRYQFSLLFRNDL